MSRRRPFRPTTFLYFDTNILDPTANQGAGGRVKALLKQYQAEAFASIQNLVEAWRAPDTTRPHLVRTILQVCRDREVEPVHYQAAMAALNEIRRRRPEWLVANPDRRSIRELRGRRRQVWERVAADPSYIPPNVANDSALRNLVGMSKHRQSNRRKLELAGKSLPSPIVDDAIRDNVQPLVDALSPPEAYWRQQTAAAWWHALMATDSLVTDLRDWLLPFIEIDRLDAESWMRFWLEVDENAVPISRVEGLLDFFQTKVEASKWGDINHAGCAVGRDYLLTADQRFYDALVRLRQQPHVVVAQPLLIDRAAADIVAAIGAALGW
jgi:hypothetical protein